MKRTLPSLLFLSVALWLASPAHAQDDFSKATAEAGIDFERWLAAGDIEQIDWKTQVLPVRLGFDQRLRVTVLGTVDGQQLSRKSARRDLHLLMRVRRPGGQWFPAFAMIRKEVPEALPKNTELEFWVPLYAAPGEYEFVLLLYDAVTGDRSLTRQRFVVEPLKKDPIPQAFRNLPAIEFLGEAVSERIPVSFGEAGRLWLPVTTRRPVRVEIVMNLSRSEEYLSPLQDRYFIGSPFFLPRRQRRPGPGALLSTLKALADVQVQNGTMHVAALDLTRRQTPFQQRDVEQFDWPRLVEAVKSVNEPVISTDALSGRQQNSAYFREALQQRLAPGASLDLDKPAAAAPCGGAVGAEQPARVLIVLSEAIVFQRGADLRPLPVPASENCRVFYLRYMASSLASFDDLDRMMKPLKPLRFDIESPMDLRRALRKIIAEIEKF